MNTPAPHRWKGRRTFWRAAGASVLCLAILVNGGCRKRTLSAFPLKAGLTEQDFKDQFGSPAKETPVWLSYYLDDGSELRLYFLEGQRGTVRSLSQATLVDTAGQFTNVFTLHPKRPESGPATTSATLPAATLPAAASPGEVR